MTLVPSNSTEHKVQDLLGLRPIIAKIRYPDLFEFSMDIERQESIVGAFITSSAIVHGGLGSLKRTWMSDFDSQNITAPVCGSQDGQTGSRPSMTFEQVCQEMDIPLSKSTLQEYGGKRVFGDCKVCFFNQFRSQGVWKNSPRAGKQCGDNGLVAWLMTGDPNSLDNCLPVIQQISSVGAGVINSIAASARIKGVQPQQLLWRVEPTGGGKKGKSMAVFIVRSLTNEEYAIVQGLRHTYDGVIRDAVERFVSGGDLGSDEPSPGQSMNDTEGTGIPM